MKADTLLRCEGMKVLRENLGLIEAERFVALIRQDSINYTEWQLNLWEGKSVDEIFIAARDFAEPKK